MKMRRQKDDLAEVLGPHYLQFNTSRGRQAKCAPRYGVLPRHNCVPLAVQCDLLLRPIVDREIDTDRYA